MLPIDIDLVEVFVRTSASVKVFHLCDLADANCPLEWWISKDGKHHALYNQEAYYDDTLRKRRESGNMICPQDKKQRLALVGHIARQIDLEPESFVELFRCRFRLESVCIDGKW